LVFARQKEEEAFRDVGVVVFAGWIQIPPC